MINPLLVRTRFLRRPLAPMTPKQLDALRAFHARLAQGFYAFEKAACVCGQRRGTLIATRDRYALPVKTYLCKSCATMWTTPRMTPESLERFYQLDYRPIYVGDTRTVEEFFQEQIRRGRAIVDFVTPAIHDYHCNTVFDIGCGAGGALIPFARAGWRTFGCDIGSEYLERGRAAGLTLRHGNATTLRDLGPANVILLCHVLEHLPNAVQSVQEMSQLLGNQGYIYAELPGIFSSRQTYGDTMLFFQNAHLYHFTLATLSAAMARAGFALVKGDERIRALFQRRERVMPAETPDQYGKILKYLYRAELERALQLARIRRRVRSGLATIGKAFSPTRLRPRSRRN